MRLRPARRGVALPALVMTTLIGVTACQGPTVAGGPAAVALHVDAPMHEPIWSDADGRLLGLTTTGSRVEQVQPSLDPGTARSTLSAPISGVGRDIAPGMDDQGVVYVPEPSAGHVAVLRVSDLKQVGSVRVGPNPAYVSTDVGAHTLLALSSDGHTVTGYNLEHDEVTTAQTVDVTPDAELDGPKRERVVEFHLTSASGIEHYLDGLKLGVIRIPTGAAVGDETKVTRIYAAQSGTDDLVAVDSSRSGDGLRIVGGADLGAPVRFVDDDAHRIYAATDDHLVVLETRAFGGFDGGKIPVLQTIDFRTYLPATARSAHLSGVADGPDRIYLTFDDQPYVLSIAKPNV